MLVRSHLNLAMLGFSIMQSKNFQMSNLDLEKEEEPEINLLTFAGSQRKLGNSPKNTYLCFSNYTRFLTVWTIKNCGKLFFMASGPITARQREGEKVEVVTDVLFLGSKITVDGYCSHEIRRRLLLGRKAMTNLESVLKSRDITPWTQVCAIKAMLSPVVTHSCELDCEGSAEPKN